MKRKVIKQGHNTLTVTLPTEWAKKFNIEGGSEVEVNEKDNGLFITTEKISGHSKAEFDISGMDIPTIWKYFMAAYREGYDEILVKFNQKKMENPYKFYTIHSFDKTKKFKEEKNPYEVLQGFVSRFIGIEIIEQGKDYVLIKEMGEPTSKEFENSLRRVFLILQQMAEETNEAIQTNQHARISNMHDIDINLDKFHDYCIRVLNKTGNKNSKKSNLLFSTLFLIELTGDEFKNIAKHISEDMPKSKYALLKEMSKSILDEVNIFYSLFYKFDKEKIMELSNMDKTIYSTYPSFYKKASEEEKEVFSHLRRISKYINSLYELRIEMEF